MHILNPRVLYAVGLIGFFPFFAFIHGYFWIYHSQSLALAVYAMKLVFLPFLLRSIVEVWPDIMRKKNVWQAVAMIAPAFLFSLMTPFIFGQGVGFYYFTDVAGFGITVGSIVIFYLLFKRNTLNLHFFEVVYTRFLVISSIYIIMYYYLWGKLKLSIPLEMHIPMALVFGALLAPTPGGYRPPIWLVPLVAVACASSMLRENLIIFIIIFFLGLLRSFVFPAPRHTVVLIIILSVIIFLGVPETRNLVANRFATVINLGHGRVDSSINQRFEEYELVLINMKKNPLSLVFGRGFGATYENIDGVLQYYGQNVHNVHSTPLTIYFRNGIYGLFLYMLPGFAAMITLFSRDVFVFRASLVVVTLYAALVFNQYFYWNVQYGFAIALWLFSLKRQ